MRSLSSRLVLTAVALVAVVALLLSVATTLAMRAYLTRQLDDRVETAARIASGPVGGDGPAPGRPPGPRGDVGNQQSGTLIANLDEGDGAIFADRQSQNEVLDDDDLDLLAQIPVDGRAHAVDLGAYGRYRAVAVQTPGGVLVTGLPTGDVDDAVGQLVTIEVLLVLLGVGAAGIAGLVVVRRQLAPLREVADTAHRVAELPLAEGEVAVEERVPARLADDRSEVGQVGAALNTLLDHVEASLDVRHRSEQQVRQFVADASHELRTPLATIAGYAELARRRPDDVGVARTSLGKVEAEAARMTSLVEDLLLLARLDAGRPLAQQPVDLTPLLVEAVSDARVVAPEHRWRLDLPDEPVEVVGDEARLHQVVTNLLTNARKHTPPGTTVTVRAHPGGFVVHDDGPGFPPALRETAFERFARGDAARTRGPDSGAGLGLALVSAITAAHGGRVALASEPGDTTVSVTLPGPSAPA